MSEPEKCSVCLCEVKLPTGIPDCCQHTFCFKCIHLNSIFDRRCPLDYKQMRAIQVVETSGGPVVKTLTLSDGSVLIETNENHEANDWLRRLRAMLTRVHAIFSDLPMGVKPRGQVLIYQETHNTLMSCIEFFRNFRAFFEATGSVFRGDDQENYSYTMKHLRSVLRVLDTVFRTLNISTHTPRLPIREHVTDFEAHVGYVHHYIIEFLRRTEVIKAPPK